MCIIITSCAGQQRLTNLDESMSYYGDLIRWGRYEDAIRYTSLKDADVAKNKIQSLAKFRVTSYNEKKRELSKDQNTAYQEVEIGYYDENYAVERLFVDKQKWAYDQTSRRWILETGMPGLGIKNK